MQMTADTVNEPKIFAKYFFREIDIITGAN